MKLREERWRKRKAFMSVEGRTIYNVLVTGSAGYIIHLLGRSRGKRGDTVVDAVYHVR